MGMFTSIRNPDPNKADIQIKCGYDQCDWYSVGDTVDWWIDPRWPYEGFLLDDVYLGCSYPDEDSWVIIKDHKIVAIEDPSLSYEVLFEKYKIQKPPADLWDEEAHARLRAREERRERDREEFRRSVEGKTLREIMAIAVGGHIRNRLNMNSAAREILQVEPLPEGDKPVCYMKGDPEEL